jgi:hypothetical protein
MFEGSQKSGLWDGQFSEMPANRQSETADLIAFTGTDQGLLRSALGPASRVAECEALGAPISVEEYTSMAPGSAKSESSASKIFRRSGMTLVFKYRV